MQFGHIFLLCLFLHFTHTIAFEGLARRKGGGGGGHGGGGGRSSPSKSNGGGSSKGGSRLSSNNQGSSKVRGIPHGSPYAGRYQGGGMRSYIYGTCVYGSGYPGEESQFGVTGRNLPFFFLPIVFVAPASLPSTTLETQKDIYVSEYGSPSDPTRLGGALRRTPPLNSIHTSSSFYLISDTLSTQSLLSAFRSRCSSVVSMTPDIEKTEAVALTDTFTDGASPYPEEAIQYYRGSTAALFLRGYNNSNALDLVVKSIPPAPFPQDVDWDLLLCLNRTIGSSIPLSNYASPFQAPPLVWTLILVTGLWFLL